MQSLHNSAIRLAVAALMVGVVLGCGGSRDQSSPTTAQSATPPAASPTVEPVAPMRPDQEAIQEQQRQAEARRLAMERMQAEAQRAALERAKAEKVNLTASKQGAKIEDDNWAQRIAEVDKTIKNHPRGPDGTKFHVEVDPAPPESPSPPPSLPATAPVPPKIKPTPPIAEQPPAKEPAAKEPAKTAPAAAAEEESSCTVVKVFYATDRSPVDTDAWRRSLRGGWPRLTVVLAMITALLGAAAWRRRERAALRRLAWCSLAITILMGGVTLVYRLQPEPAGRVERMYGNDRGELELGTCEVSIPKEHELGEMESPSILRLEFREDPERHVVLQNVRLAPAEVFYSELQACVGRSPRKEAFVFVHGYNVGFADAARRTAQIAYDLKFDGAPIFYSWPSQSGLLAYMVDETNVAWTVPHLKSFLLGIARQSHAEAIQLIAHSMGNRALTSALRELALELKADCPRYHEVILTAPDIDADVFRRDLAPAIVATARRVTLYASSNDEALIASKAVHGYRRAGDSGQDVVVVPGVDTVDVSSVDTSLIGHCYYGSNRTVLADLFELIHSSKPPGERKWLRSMEAGVLKYWKFLRDPG